MKRLILLLALLLPSVLRAQAPVPHGILTVATTTTGASPWIYVRWHALDSSTPFGTPFAVYLKNAPADAAVPLQAQGVSIPAGEESIAALQLSRAAGLGTDLPALERDIAAYTAVVENAHQALSTAATPNTAPLARKLARLIHQARAGDNRTAEALRQMALAHPGIALAIGEAWAGPITAAAGSQVTVELRSWDPVTCQETGIAGRITVTAGQPETLLAPGAPIQVPDTTGTGDRVVKLRWATSDALRRQTPLATGYSVFRVTPATAQARGWLAAPPAATALRSLAATNPASVKLLTDTPLQIGKLFSAASAPDFGGGTGDAVTHYLTDDNNRYAANAANEIVGVPYPDGTRHYYFAIARDLLGRDGAVSPAGEGTACTRLAPPVPAEFALLDESITTNGTVCQCFTLRWKANAPEGDNDTDEYQIFRGSQQDTPNADLSVVSTLNAVKTIAHAPDAEGMMQWRDETLPQGIAGRTYWYAIRAVHRSPCAPDNFSRVSPQVYGTLRTSVAPPAPQAAQAFQCPLVGLMLDAVSAPGEYADLPAEEQDSARRTLRLIIRRTDPGVEWIETKWSWLDYAETEFTRLFFDPDTNEVTADFALPASPSADGPAFLRIQAGSASGAVSAGAGGLLLSRNFGIPSDKAGWTADKVRIFRGKAAAPAPGEVNTANADHVAMFSLNAAAVNLAAVPAGNRCYTAPLAAPDHTPYVIQASRGGLITVAGAETAGGRLYFCDPGAPDPAAAGFYRAIPISTGPRACIHFADGSDGSIRPIMLRLALPPDYGEYRIYRRVDDGPLSLLAQGDGRWLAANATEFIRQDDAIPATASVLRYYGQTFDKQGQGSPLVPLGDPILLGRKDVSVPVLRTPRPGGTLAAPTLRLEWFCPPEGIERFRIRLDPDKAPSSGAPNRNLPATLFQVEAAKPSYLASWRQRASRVSRLRAANLSGLTGLVGENQPLGAGPVFTSELPVKAGTRYKITMQAISVAGVNSGASKEYLFAWTPPPPPPQVVDEPGVAWPQRSLPDPGFWHPLVRADLTKVTTPEGNGIQERWDIVAPGSFSDYPVGVRIAAINGRNQPLAQPDEQPAGTGHMIGQITTNQFKGLVVDEFSDISGWLLKRRDTGTLFPSGAALATGGIAATDSSLSRFNLAGQDKLLPAVLYRRQVPSQRFSSVSGATLQVSPLISSIAADQLDYTHIRDPFIGVVNRLIIAGPGRGTYSMDLFLLDTQPVQKGARYHYTLVRFSAADGAMLESIDAGEILIPETF